MNRKGKQKNSPRKAPIYRSTERLISWAMPVVDSLPKSLAAQTLACVKIKKQFRLKEYLYNEEVKDYGLVLRNRKTRRAHK